MKTEAIASARTWPVTRDHERGDDDGRGPDEVAQHLEVGAAQRQALALRVPQHERARHRSRAARSTATASISPDSTSGGAFQRRHASTSTNAATANSSIALTTAARISRRIRP